MEVNVKKLICLLLSFLLIFSLTACAKKDNNDAGSKNNGNNTSQNTDDKESKDTNGTDKSDEAKEPLNVWVRNSYYEQLSRAAEIFTEQTGIPVKITEPSNMSDDLSLALSSGKTPDIVSIDCVLIPYYASIGALEDITSQFNNLEFKDSFTGGLLDLAKYQENQYAVPFAPDVSVLLYNKDIFEAAGLDPEKPPTTWAELIEYGQKCSSDDTYGYIYTGGYAGGMMFTFAPYIWSNGGEFTSSDGTQSMLDTEEAKEALQLFVDMVHEYKITPESITSYDWTACLDAFKSGKAAMIVLGARPVGEIVNDTYDFKAGCGLIPSPDGTTYSSFSGGDSMAILANSDKKDDAWKFIEFCLSEEFQVGELVTFGNIPARTDLFDNEHYEGHKEYQVLREALKVGQAPYSLKYNEMYAPWLDAIQFAINKEKTVDQALADAKAEIDAILAD
ncbi:MAG: ABC transporter substrate-binding protein [Anaerolineaceae bacterium]|nr:MAG: ABC transporter substrate-binding protein [Anaerolineaceae bacterium]